MHFQNIPLVYGVRDPKKLLQFARHWHGVRTGIKIGGDRQAWINRLDPFI